MIIGASQGFTKRLVLKGVGYRFQSTDKPNTFLLFIGFTNAITLHFPLSIECKLINNTTLEGKSIDLQLLTNTFNKFRLIKAANKDTYKGKGILII
jgi:large subunit ribosomal protein L6